MQDPNKLLSDIVAFRTYAKYIPHLMRRESLEETISRTMKMHLDKFPKLSRDIVWAFKYVYDLKVMPSMRTLQFSGDAILKNHARLYNCSALNIDNIRAFGEALFLLLSGVGVGYSVQNRHISQLPKVSKPSEEGIFVAHDSIQGWAQCLDVLMEAYFLKRIRPVFDLSKIRHKGAYLSTTGAKAPGPEPLRVMLQKTEEVLKNAIGRKLTSLEVHDIMCIVADAVLAGGIRRAAMISLFDRDDELMLSCKQGSWWEKHPYRARANNSAILPRKEVTKEEFLKVFQACRDSNSGEPGFSFTNNPDMLFNPCHEISLHSNQFCNLVSVNQTNIRTEKELMKRVKAATIIATLQATYTDFPYLRPIWKEITDKEALIGVSFTGVADNVNFMTKEMLTKAAQLVKEVNEKTAKKLKINPAARCTTLKPEGSSSTVIGSSSGIHARHSEYYIRRIRMNKDDSLAKYLASVIPEFVEDDVMSATGIVVSIPQKSPKNAITREQESAFDLFERAKMYNQYWIRNGHRKGDNYNNVSCTISVKEDEWDKLAEKMWKDRNYYTGISLLPYDGGSYQQAPFEAISKEKYEEMVAKLPEVDLSKVIEKQDYTDRTSIVACSGGACELNI